MSLLPLLFRDVARPLRMMDHQMRLDEELFPFLVYRTIPRGRNPLEVGDGKESVTQDRDKFQVKLDVENFSPEEITIKAIDGNAIVVEAKHEKSDENGHICRQFYRKFVIPKGHDMKKVESVLSADGIPTITAPNKVEQVEERAIPITHVDTSEAIPRGRNPLEAGDGKESVIQDRDKFQVKLDVENFSPEEITIKAIDGNAIVVEAKHEKSDENGHICRQFYRKFVIPKGHDMKKVESVLSADGIPTITAPNKVEQVEERAIPITHVDTREGNN
ncbi:hypothetical protein PPYR_14002 [Photinus pyralis]|uniref:SHSP domain-containing protein n=1 Tax=Photinus pyralis TaxID=7054 RepID=A0A5N4A409_PHOPY|nr:hypothetical protein PPYR_14002 [Photinus pyralis]